MSNKTGIRKKINGGVSIAVFSLACTRFDRGNCWEFRRTSGFCQREWVLALLMIAKPAPIPTISFRRPTPAHTICLPLDKVRRRCMKPGN